MPICLPADGHFFCIMAQKDKKDKKDKNEKHRKVTKMILS